MTAALDERLPNFFLAGVAISGTTSLATYLAQHPQITISRPKEPHFFTFDDKYAEGVEKYLEVYFKGAEGFPARGDASTTTFSHPGIVIPRLRAVYGAQPLRFLVVVRDPVARAWSHYQYQVSRGLEDLDFEAALEVERTQPRPGFYAYRGRGLYATHLRKWLEFYPLSSFHFLLNEELSSSPAATLTAIFTFLGVDPGVTVDTSQRRNTAAQLRSRTLANLINHPPAFLQQAATLFIPNSEVRTRWQEKLRLALRKRNGSPPPAIPPAIAARLREEFRPEIEGLQELIGRDLSHWLTPKPDGR
jgi:hypothetical protein